jgi:hypothetical protein
MVERSDSTLSLKARRRVDAKLQVTANRFFNELGNNGIEKYCVKAWNGIEKTLRQEIRETTKSHQGIEGSEGILPGPQAIEHGMIIGAFLASLSDIDFAEYRRTMAGNLSAIRRFSSVNPRDLEDIVVLQGHDYAQYLMINKPSGLIVYGDGSNSVENVQEQELFISAVGYMGAATVTALVAAEIRRGTNVNRAHENQIRVAADNLQSDGFVVPIGDIIE